MYVFIKNKKNIFEFREYPPLIWSSEFSHWDQRSLEVIFSSQNRFFPLSERPTLPEEANRKSQTLFLFVKLAENCKVDPCAINCILRHYQVNVRKNNTPKGCTFMFQISPLKTYFHNKLRFKSKPFQATTPFIMIRLKNQTNSFSVS